MFKNLIKTILVIALALLVMGLIIFYQRKEGGNINPTPTTTSTIADIPCCEFKISPTP